MKLTYDDILLRPGYSEVKSKTDTDISTDEYSMPIFPSPMDNVCSKEMLNLCYAKKLPMVIDRFKFENSQQQANYVTPHYWNNCWFAVGSSNKYHRWILELIDTGITNFIVDIAHGDSKIGHDTVNFISKHCYDAKIITSNIATGEAAERYINNCNNIENIYAFRCGIGVGQICSTRLNTACGVPQVSAIEEITEIIDNSNSNIKLIADGGIKHPGDIVKALAAGADFVMLGKMFAATDLALGENYDINKSPTKYLEYTKYKEYHGMASRKCARSNTSSIEGVEGLIPYIGTTENFLKDLKNNLHSALSLTGCMNWKDLQIKYPNIKQVISSASILEGRTHVENF